MALNCADVPLSNYSLRLTYFPFSLSHFSIKFVPDIQQAKSMY